MEEIEALIILNSIEGLGFRKLKCLKEKLGSFTRVFSQTEEDLVKIEGITKNLATKIKEAFRNFDLKKELRLIKENEITLLSLEDRKYPENLKEIYDPPYLLYLRGEFKESDKNALAIVGSRFASYYGISLAEKFSFLLALRGITIVSGLARGIDTQAHRGALKAKGRTLAVLGSGLINIYPEENKKLAEEIAQNGVLFSEFPMETPPLKQNFPRRNRIISGLSRGVVVVEAGEKSGALITADFALEQGREVFALPGKIDSPTSRGTHNLIKQGAKLVSSVEDILEELKLDTTGLKEENNRPLFLEGREQIVYTLLEDEPKHIDGIRKETGFSLTELSDILLRLELKGLIKQLPGKMFVRRG
ncbi:MAG: DNA-processing protein DprA [Candidatus Omnitrophica bacterium]|nr:DNA-processing protein DprA [Candidatus Omnitrophota bacterium]MCM8793922.1 DNA-processing protein DprA [Candidatus Omnitrophota bacterium]